MTVKDIDVHFIDISDVDQKSIYNVFLPTFPPFVIGQEVELSIKNQNPVQWDVEPIDKTFIVRRIEFKFEKTYRSSSIIDVYEYAFMFVFVSEKNPFQ